MSAHVLDSFLLFLTSTKYILDLYSELKLPGFIVLSFMSKRSWIGPELRKYWRSQTFLSDAAFYDGSDNLYLIMFVVVVVGFQIFETFHYSLTL